MGFVRRRRSGSRDSPCWMLVCAAMFIALNPRPSKAWNYQEHWSISYVSYSRACEELKVQYAQDPAKLGKIEELCSIPVKLCVAHMSGVAGDYVEGPKALAMDAQEKDPHFLVDEDFDQKDNAQ